MEKNLDNKVLAIFKNLVDNPINRDNVMNLSKQRDLINVNDNTTSSMFS